jgi:hypothetical protein
MTQEDTVDVVQPVIVSLGKQRRKRIKQLKRGKGKLMDQVMDVVDEVQQQIASQNGETRVFVPIVIIYKEKARKRLGIFG